ncbi:MAG: FAD-dependent oxidoreductase [Candidatus Izemoplasmatales bacterium]|nr:FAD-dependent oxidoreductase [Candidatus Izemoplasmatales bacterium]
MRRVDIAIIGAGPAGMNAALYASKEGKTVALFDRHAAGGRIRATWRVDNVLGFGELSAEELVQKMVHHLAQLGVHAELGNVEDVRKRPDRSFDLTVDGENLIADAVIVACGTGPKPLGVKGEERLLARGVSYCAICDATFFEKEDVAVIGGGDSALEEAIYLAQTCKSVTVIHDLHKPTGSPSVCARVYATPNIHILSECRVEEFLGEEELEAIQYLDLEDGNTKKLSVRGAFVYVGNRADTGFLNHVLDRHGDTLNVDSQMRTTTLGVFACGDVTKKEHRYIVTAISDGAIAALSALQYLEQRKG